MKTTANTELVQPVVKKRKKSLFHTEGFKGGALLLPYGIVFSMFILIPVVISSVLHVL